MSFYKTYFNLVISDEQFRNYGQNEQTFFLEHLLSKSINVVKKEKKNSSSIRRKISNEFSWGSLKKQNLMLQHYLQIDQN